jgi:hypothetical protein
MNPIQQLRDAAQSIRRDNITSDLLNGGTLGDNLYTGSRSQGSRRMLRLSTTPSTTRPSPTRTSSGSAKQPRTVNDCSSSWPSQMSPELPIDQAGPTAMDAASVGAQGCAGSAGVIHMLGSSDAVRCRHLEANCGCAALPCRS